VIKIVAQ